ncbi:Cytoplasmic dynein 2 heavy chain 1 [Aphelenchoides besseyi]|nr:Cytoplasmic dynein 2 heavy chain 1 [Aphelenchoides besseyi]
MSSAKDAADSRKSYILRIASHLVSLNLIEEKLPNVNALQRFCDTNTQRLIVTRLDSKGHVDVRNEVPTDQKCLFRVIFYKQHDGPLTKDYKREISVLTANEQQLSEAFLKTITQIYGELPSASIAHTNGTANLTNGHFPLASDRFNLAAELRYWTKTADPGGFSEIFEPLSEKFTQLDQLTLEECEEFVDTAIYVVDGLWTNDLPYEQSRMEKLLEAISRVFSALFWIIFVGYEIYLVIRSKIKIDDFWSNSTAVDQVHVAIALCEQWIVSVQLMTSQTWLTHTNEWRGKPAKLDLITGYKKRLDEISIVRRLCDQVLFLLESGNSNRVTAAVESAMSGVNPFIYDALKNDEILSRLHKVESILDGFIDSVVPAFRTKLNDSGSNGGNPVADIYKYPLFMRIVEHFRQRRYQYENQNNIATNTRYLTEIGARVVWIRSNIVQFRQIDEVCQNLFTDLSAYSQFDRELKSFMSELKSFESEQFDNWSKDLIREIDDPTNSIALETAGRLMQLDHTQGTLNVSFSDRLVGLLREVSQLSSLGFAVPRKILQCTRTAEQFYRYGNVLKQVAHFYNTIEQQMLPSQQAMMLEQALKFERLLMPKGSKDGVNITWDDPKKLQEYIEQLQEAVLGLTNQNRQLRKAHMEIYSRVLKLLQLDFTKDVEKWSSAVAEVRQRFAEEERRVANPANMRPWAIHWDKQLYKIVQLQFQWGMQNLQTVVGTINIQLILRDQNLHLRPSLHETKAKYYEDMQKFFALPATLRSIQRFNNTKNDSPFASISLLNADKFPPIYAQSERYFAELSTIEQRYDEWLWLSRLNVEDLVAEHFKEAEDWERQLETLKGITRRADELPSEVSIGPISVSLVSFKNSLSTMFRGMVDTLHWTLRYSINTGLQSMSNLIKEGMTILTTKPQSLQEVGETNQKYVILKKDLTKMANENARLNQQNVLLRRLTGNGVSDLGELNNDLERYKHLLEMFDEVIREQVDQMKATIGDRVKQLTNEAERLNAHWTQFKPSGDVLQAKGDVLTQNIEFIREHQEKFAALALQYENLKLECEQFDLPPVEIHIFDQMAIDLDSAHANYTVYEEFEKELKMLGEMEWILFRNKAYLFDEFLQEWTQKLKSTQVTPIVIRLQRTVEGMQEFAGCLKFCRGESLSQNHWTEFFRLVHLPRGISLEQLTFGDLVSVRQHVIANVDQLKNLAARAQGEAAIREALQELELWAAQAEFALRDYKHSNGQTIKIIREWKEPIYQVKDNQTLLISLKNSPHYAQFKDQTGVWERRITDLDTYLQQMNQIQRQPIFGRGALPTERSRFQRADAEFRSILHDIGRDPRLVKRVAFPRFYFLGDDDMLEILGQSTNPTIIQNHLKKLFQGIDRVIFDQEHKFIRGIISPEGEQVALLKPVQIVADVENYLKDLVDEIRATLKKLLLDCLAESNLDPSRYPTQVVCLAEEIRFTRDTEQLLDREGSVDEYKTQLVQQLDQFTQIAVDDTLMNLRLKSLILDIIHHINIVDVLLQSKDKTTKSWAWQKQVRFYMRGNNVMIQHGKAQFEYTYEYQGCASRLVHTPLTDKCYLTLTQALSLGLGGNPFGPAGTGKTESVKALGNLMGRQVLVFNCDEGIDVHAIGRMFIGLIQCGAWGCFDEFNRLDKDVLSTVSSQIQTIQDAIRSRTATCELNARQVKVDFNAAIFITLNPVGRGYGGRQRLPDNLKQLFRPVVMSKPNSEEIAETLLFAEGFKTAKNMAKKIVTAFEMSRDLLSNQQHYDWGLRSMKTVLKGCGSALAANRQANEQSVVLQTLRLSTLSKLTFADFTRFNALLDDVFPDGSQDSDHAADILEHVRTVATEKHLELNDAQMTKIVELQEQLSRRMGVVIVGPAGTGKSTLWQVLRKAMERMGTTVDLHTVNPKAMPRQKFLGEMNIDTREWTDGVLTSVAREVVKDTKKRAWIVCDGDVDPEWIEALNSVLDDNRLLTMPTGERIQFADNVNFIFETDSLAHASPATISRMGMIYISDEIVDVKSQIKRLIAIKNSSSNVADWLNDQLPAALDWQSRNRESELATSKVAIIENVFSLTWNAQSLDEFRVGLLRGLLPFTSSDSYGKLAQELVFQGTSLPDLANSWNVYFDNSYSSLQSFTDDLSTTVTLNDMKYEENRPTILTARMKIARDTVNKWLVEDNRQSFCVMGPDGSGKDQLLRGAFAEHYKSTLVRVNCGAQTSALDVMNILIRNCVQVSSASGRALKPKDKDYLIVYLKSIDLIQPDKYGSSMTIAFLEELLYYRGFYDTNNDWTTLENVQIVCTFAYPSSSGRSVISSRFLCLTRSMIMEPPSDNELVVVCSAYLMPVLNDYFHSNTRVEAFAASLVQIYKRIKDKFAVVTQTHYAVSTRDLVNWILAFVRYPFTSDNIHTLLPAVSVFEGKRIFGDRFINAEHRQHFDSIINEVFPTQQIAEQIFVPIPGAFLWHTSVMGKPMEQSERRAYVQHLTKCVNRYEFEVANFRFTLSNGLVDLCIALDRTLTQAGGSVLIAGVADYSLRAVALLVAHMHGFRLFSPRISSSYRLKQFCNDLKQAMIVVAVESEPAVFLVEDYQLRDPVFIQYINQLLSTGSVPGLFTAQEFEQMSGQLRELASQDGYDGELASYFANSSFNQLSVVELIILEIKRHLHVVIILDVNNAAFSERLQTNPALYKFCTVIWRPALERDSLAQSAKLALENAELEETRPNLSDIFCDLYANSPLAVRTPPKFIVFLNNFVQIYRRKGKTVNERLKRLKAGVDKLTETRDQVAKMQKKAAKKSKLLAEKQEAADRALSMITQSMTGAQEQREDMENLRVETEKETQNIAEKKKKIDEQLKDVQPLLETARQAVGSIKSESLSEIRSLRAPPDAIRDILQAVLLFMGIQDNSWEAMRKFLAKNGVKDEIINFDARNVTDEMHKRVQALVRTKANSFDEKVAKRASTAAAPLANWVMANLQYAEIVKKTRPLDAEKKTLEQKLNQTKNEMKNLSTQLSSVDAHVEKLKQEFEESMKSATQIKIDLDREQAAILVAGTMVERLGNEYKRWQTQMENLQTELEKLDIHCALASAFVTFLGVEAFDNRHKVVHEWLQICQLPNFDVVSFLNLEVDQQKWKSIGLPSTKIATENASIIFNTTETPFIIDSTGVVASFLRRLYKDADVQLLLPTQPDFLTQIELGVRFGKCVILDDVYEIEPALVPLLRKEFFSQGPRQVCQIGEKQVDVNDNFRFFICTRNEQIRLPGYVRNGVVEVNFSTTLAGLSSQILSLALNTAHPELEQKSVQLSSETELLNLQLAEIEQVLLNELATSEGSLLDNTQLIDSLNQSKESAERAEKSLAVLESVRHEIDEQKQIYMPFSEKCSLLYFAFNTLHRENHMYNFNVKLILSLFQKVFAKNQSSNADTNTKLTQIYQELVHIVFYYVSRAIFKQDRLAFALRFVRVVQPKLFEDREWNFFTGDTQDDENVNHSAHLPSWIGQQNQSALQRLQSALPQLYHQLNLDDRGTWSEFANGGDASLPKSIGTKLSPFQRVLAVQALRPERLNTVLNKFVCSTLGLTSINPPSSDLNDILQNFSTQTQPIFLILGASADPAQEIADLADKTVGRARYHHLAMGTSQQSRALELLQKCMQNGDWLCLSNVHLVAEFLLKIYGELNSRQPQSSFCLWLTAEPDDGFPAVPLQESLKIAYESPPGIKHNLQRTLVQWTENEQWGTQTSEYLQRVYFVLAWLHAILQERRTFIPQGWLKFYEFNSNDLRVARQTIEKETQGNGKRDLQDTTNWEAVRGFMEDAIYGGRIENQLDIGCLRAYLRQYINAHLMGDSQAELGNGIRLPRLSNMSQCIQFVQSSISGNDSPSIFGLPENLLSTWEVAQSQKTITKLRAFHIETETNETDFVFSEWSNQLIPILASWKKLNQNSDLHQQVVTEVRGSGDPVLEMLSTELHFGVLLLKKIHTSLSLIRRGLSGKQSPNAKTIQLAKSLAKKETPIDWDLQWAGPLQCYEYMELVCQKARKIRSMSQLSDSSTLFNGPINLEDFFRPTALLNALRQFMARKTNTSVDNLKFATSLDRISDDVPQLQLSKLKIQGASLTGGRLAAVSSNSPTFSTAPTIYVAWIPVSTQLPYNEVQSVDLPLFVSDDRAEFVALIRVPCGTNEQTIWTLASVAMFTKAI